MYRKVLALMDFDVFFFAKFNKTFNGALGDCNELFPHYSQAVP